MRTDDSISAVLQLIQDNSHTISSDYQDLAELAGLIADYVIPGKEVEWLRTPLPAFGGRCALNLINKGKTRDIIAEFRRLQHGEPL